MPFGSATEQDAEMPWDERQLPALSVVLYKAKTEDTTDEVFVSLRDGSSWDPAIDHREQRVLVDGDLDVELLLDRDDRVVGVLFNDASVVHPTLLAAAVPPPDTE